MSEQIRTARIENLRLRLSEVRGELRAALAEDAACTVRDYEFSSMSGLVSLSALFGDKRDLFLIHNMGVGCALCTMWADGFNGLYPHIIDRAAFVVVTPDPPERQQAFAAERGWRFPIVSHVGTTFAADMGFVDKNGGHLPGVSAFQMSNDKIRRVSAAPFHLYDDFCPIWHLFELLPEGAAGWRPQYRYG